MLRSFSAKSARRRRGDTDVCITMSAPIAAALVSSATSTRVEPDAVSSDDSGRSAIGRSGGSSGLETAGWEKPAKARAANTEKRNAAAVRMEAIRCKSLGVEELSFYRGRRSAPRRQRRDEP